MNQSFSLCKYANVFGPPRTGVHATRIPFLDIAFWDTVGTVGIALLLHYSIPALRKHNAAWTISGLFLIAIIMHYAFCVPTRLNQALNIADTNS